MSDDPHTFTIAEAGWYSISHGCGFTEIVKLDSPDDPEGELVDLRLWGWTGGPSRSDTP